MILLFLGHNFWTRNARKQIKGSKNSSADYSLFSNKNLSQKIPSSGYDVTHKKPATQNLTIFIANWKTCRIFWGFEPLSSTIN